MNPVKGEVCPGVVFVAVLIVRNEVNWSVPDMSHEVVVKLIGATMTKTGLKVKARLDKRKYPLKVKVSDEDMQSLNIELHKFHGEWNYTIKPRNIKKPK